MPIKRSRPKPTGLPGIKQDGPNRFLVCRTVVDPRTGQRRKKEGVAATLAAAATLWEELLVELQAGVRTRTRSRQRFSDYVNEWVDNHLHHMEESTRTYYTNNLAHLVVHFGQFYVDAIRSADIREWRTAMERKEYRPRPSKKNPKPKKRKYSVATINGWHRVLRNVLEDAKVVTVQRGGRGFRGSRVDGPIPRSFRSPAEGARQSRTSMFSGKKCKTRRHRSALCNGSWKMRRRRSQPYSWGWASATNSSPSSGPRTSNCGSW